MLPSKLRCGGSLGHSSSPCWQCPPVSLSSINAALSCKVGSWRSVCALEPQALVECPQAQKWLQNPTRVFIQSWRWDLPTLPSLSLFFWNSLSFSPCDDFLVLFGSFPSFSRDSMGSVGIKSIIAKPARNHFSLNFCHFFGCGSDVVRTWSGCGSDVVRMRFGHGSDVVQMWVGRGSDVFSDLVQTVWQKLRESGFQQQSPTLRV